jgi:hypothetical protein
MVKHRHRRFLLPVGIFLWILPVWGGTLSGQLTNHQGDPISNGQVVAIHQQSPLIMQKGFSDRNGFFTLGLNSGPYLCLVLKESHAPLVKRVVIKSNHENQQVTWVLPPPLPPDKDKQTIRQAIRDNLRNP